VSPTSRALKRYVALPAVSVSATVVSDRVPVTETGLAGGAMLPVPATEPLLSVRSRVIRAESRDAAHLPASEAAESSWSVTGMRKLSVGTTIQMLAL
jgi:hypothetical protein